MRGTSYHAGENARQAKDETADGHLKSRVVKRSLVVGGHKTSVSLEDVFWNALRLIAHNRHVTLSEMVGNIDSERQHCNLSSAIRLFVFDHTCRQSDYVPRQNEMVQDCGASPWPRRP